MNGSVIGSGHTGPHWVPTDACTLPTREQPLRVAAFDRLFAEALVGAELVADAGEPRGNLLLAGEEDLVRRVRELVAAETSCCSFFTFDVSEQPGRQRDGVRSSRVRVDVAVPAARRDVLEAQIGRARDRAGLPTRSAAAD